MSEEKSQGSEWFISGRVNDIFKADAGFLCKH